jgi:drug/metabolite transporter (DMT)-like permease
MERKYWWALAALAAVWGASYMFIKIALTGFSPAMVVFLRTALAAVCLSPFCIKERPLYLRPRKLGLILCLACVQVSGPFLLITIGERQISSSLAGILVSTTPIFAALIAYGLSRDERVSGQGFAGIAIGLVGVLLLLGIDTQASDPVASLGVLLAACGYAIGAFLVRHRFAGEDPVAVSQATMTASAAVTAPVAFSASGLAGIRPAAWLAVGALGVIGTGIAFALFYKLIGNIGPARASLVTYLAPGFAVVYGAVFLSETITAATLAGLALVVFGSAVTANGGLGWLRRRRLAGALGLQKDRA